MVLNASKVSTETLVAERGDSTPEGLIMLVRAQTQTVRLKGLIVPLFKLGIFLLHTWTTSKISWVRLNKRCLYLFKVPDPFWLEQD